MNLEYLDEFIHLAHSLSFRNTAEHFYVSRSVISRHLAALEESLGAILLERGARGVQLTEAGAVFLQEAQAMLRSWDLAQAHVRAAANASDELVRIGYHEARQAMEEHSIDIMLGINVERSLSRNYRSTPIYEDRFVVACSRTNPLARLDEVMFDDLRDQKVLVPDSYIAAGLGPQARELIDDETLAECEGLYENMDQLYLTIQTEECAAFVSNLNASMFASSLKILPIKDMDTTFTISAYYHDSFTGIACELCRQSLEECKLALAQEAPETFCW